MTDIKSMTQEEITDALRAMGEPAFRGKQVFSWLHKGATDFAEMNNLSKPLREKLLGLDKLTDALKCQLRHDMLHTYYRHREDKTIRQYEMEDFLLLYRGYKALGGNSFIDRIKSEIDEWEVVS